MVNKEVAFAILFAGCALFAGWAAATGVYPAVNGWNAGLCTGMVISILLDSR